MADTKRIDAAIRDAEQKKANAATERKRQTIPPTTGAKRQTLPPTAGKRNTVPPPPPVEEPKKGRKRLTEEDRAERDRVYNLERLERKAAKNAAKEQRRLEREQRPGRGEAHMAKVDRVISKLPQPTDAVRTVLDLIQNSALKVPEVESIAAHLAAHARKERTRQSSQANVKAGDMVRIISGNHLYIGQEAIVNKVQRIRCYVRPIGSDKEIYLFTSDVAQSRPDVASASPVEETANHKAA